MEVLGRHGLAYQMDAMHRRLERRSGRAGRCGRPRPRASLPPGGHDLRRLERGAEQHHRQGRVGIVTRCLAPRGSARKQQDQGAISTCQHSVPDERRLLHESLQDYLGTTYSFAHFRAMARTGDRFGRENWATTPAGMARHGLARDVGGAGGGVTELGIVMSACGQGLLLEPLLATVVLGASAIERAGTPEQQATSSPRSPPAIFCWPSPQRARWAAMIATTCARSRPRSGAAGGSTARRASPCTPMSPTQIIVSARVGGSDGPVGLFLRAARRRRPAVSAPAPPSMAGPGAELELKGVEVPASARLGTGDEDADRARSSAILDRGAIAVCAEACGAMRPSTRSTLDYLKKRKQFGQTAGELPGAPASPRRHERRLEEHPRRRACSAPPSTTAPRCARAIARQGQDGEARRISSARRASSSTAAWA